MECHTRHRSSVACCPVSLDRSDSPPVCGPQKRLAPNNYQQPHETSRSGHYKKANSATRSESGPKFRHATNRVNAADKSFQNRNPIVSAASARECHFGVRTEFQAAGSRRSRRDYQMHRCTVAYFVQSSSFKLPSLRNTRSFVTRMASRARACAAIIMSKLPIGFPCRSSVARTSA